MVSAPLPPDEAQRLKNLDSYLLLDTPYEDVFDEIASLAAKICGVPYAIISLLDSKRQWFKAAHGLGEVRETSRDISFCGHAILQDEVFYVPDAQADARFHDNPFVTGTLSIKVYAGMPLASEEGYKLGTLCVLSDRPTPLSDVQLESLKQLSHVLTALFKARKKEARLAFLGQVLDQLDDEVVLADPATLECTYANAAAHRAFTRYADGEGMPALTLTDITQAASSPQRQRMTEALRSGEQPHATLEVQRPGRDGDGEAENTVELRLQRLTTGAIVKIAAIGHDISERKKLEKVKAELHESLERHHRELGHAYGVLSEELALAREMQLRFLPPPKTIRNVSFDWLFRASSYVGGDIFDYFALDDRYLCFHVIDVSGHGVSAALLAFNAQREMFSARTDMLVHIREGGGDIARAAELTIKAFNRKFVAMNASSLYLTMLFGILDTHTGDVALVQAGHPPPYFCTPETAAVKPIGEGGLPIGILDHADYDAHLLCMTPGARLYLYSDGVTDCADDAEEMFGEARMEQLLASQHRLALPKVRDALGNALLAWRGSKDGFDDDVTFLTVEYRMPNQTPDVTVITH